MKPNTLTVDYETLMDLVNEEVRRLTADEFEMRVRAEVIAILNQCGLESLVQHTRGLTKAN